MDIGAAGALIQFFSLFVALILVALLVFAYAAYSFLVVLSNTAVGYDEVIWPGEPMQDWFFQGWYLGWLLAVWAVPASFLVRLLALPRPLFAVCVAGCLWLLFPIGLLSSLSAESRLLVLRPAILWVLLKHFGVVLRFYVSSGLLVLVCGALAYAALFGMRFPALALDLPMILIPLAAAVCAAGGLAYARLLGRIAFITSQSSAEEPAKAADSSQAREEPLPPPQEPRSGEPPKKKKRRTRKPNRAVDPWAIPAEEPPRKTKPVPPSPRVPHDPYGPAEGTYEVIPEEASTPLSRVAPGSDPLEPDEVGSYAVSASTEASASPVPPPKPAKFSKLEAELAAPRVLPPLPLLPLVNGVYSFAFYPQSVGPCFTVALGLLGVFALLRLLFFVVPF